jgi:hypothetical protein
MEKTLAAIRRENDGNLIMVYMNIDDFGAWLECFDGKQHVTCERGYILEKTKPVDPSAIEAIQFAYRYVQHYHADIKLTTFRELMQAVNLSNR